RHDAMRNIGGNGDGLAGMQHQFLARDDKPQRAPFDGGDLFVHVTMLGNHGAFLDLEAGDGQMLGMQSAADVVGVQLLRGHAVPVVLSHASILLDLYRTGSSWYDVSL